MSKTVSFCPLPAALKLMHAQGWHTLTTLSACSVQPQHCLVETCLCFSSLGFSSATTCAPLMRVLDDGLKAAPRSLTAFQWNAKATLFVWHPCLPQPCTASSICVLAGTVSALPLGVTAMAATVSTAVTTWRVRALGSQLWKPFWSETQTPSGPRFRRELV